MKKKMKTRNVWVSLFVIASILLSLVSVNVAAVTEDLAYVNFIQVDGVVVFSGAGYYDVGVIAGETVYIKVTFTALENASDVRMEVEIVGDKIDVDKEISVGDVEQNRTYQKTLTLDVPYELQDEKSDDLALNLRIWNSDFETKKSVTLRVQRPSYNVGFMSVSVDSVIEAGDIFPVEVVLKNTGYNNLSDLYVTAGFPALDVKKTAYFGDLVAIETDEEDDTVSGRLYLQVPYDAQPGTYTLEVTVTNDDLTLSNVKQIAVKNEFYNNVIVTDYRKTVAVGKDAEYELLIVNPTNKLKVYRVVTESTNTVTSSASESVVAVPAGSSKSVKVLAKANSQGEYDFDVNVFSGEELVSTVTLNVNAEGGAIANPIVVLTIVLAIIFLVLLGVLVVLITRKPKKVEEYEESYY